AAGFCIEIFGVLWDTAMQQEIPPEKLSRLFAYDMLGSLALTPLALAAVGPISAAVGVRETLIGFAILPVGENSPVLLSPDVPASSSRKRTAEKFVSTIPAAMFVMRTGLPCRSSRSARV